MNFAKSLLTWFDEHGRHDLPWQKNMTPYRVWVSEIMLQQTQVKTVIPYYLRFMKSFPTVQSLAKATQEQVLAHWAGLGYYARGRNLHKSAQIIVTDYQGDFPQTYDDIIELSGIGRSTAGAVLSLSLQRRMPILDGNVKRVLCRFDAIKSWSGNKKTETTLWARADELTPIKRFKDYTQAIMDLGATVCTRSQTKCIICPVAKDRDAKKSNNVVEFPYSKPKKVIRTKERYFLILQTKDGLVGLVQRPQKGIWGGLWSLVEFDSLAQLNLFLEQNQLAKEFQRLTQFKHTFSHYHLLINPILVQNKKCKIEGIRWFEVEELTGVGLPTPINKILRNVLHFNRNTVASV